MTTPIVTVVIPTYRRPTMLSHAIQSVLNQTFRDFRICVYDNASGGETATVVEQFRKIDSRVEYFCRPANIGAFANFVDGANRVKTPYFSFLPDDDVLLPHFFESALSGFRMFPESALSILATLKGSVHGIIHDAWVMRWPSDGLIMPPEGMLYALRHGNPGLPAMLIRRDVWDEFGGLDEATEPCSDFDFELRVLAQRPVAVCRRPGAIQVMHPASATAGVNLSWVWPVIPEINRKLHRIGLAGAAIREADVLLTRQFRRNLFVWGVLHSLQKGKWSEAERAADLLEQECGLVTKARVSRRLVWMCRQLPGVSLIVRALVVLRTGEKAMRNLDLQWEFLAATKLLRSSAR